MLQIFIECSTLELKDVRRRGRKYDENINYSITMMSQYQFSQFTLLHKIRAPPYSYEVGQNHTD